MSIPSAAFLSIPTHLLDERRPIGKYNLSSPREDGTGYVAQVKQFPVICAVDFVELHTSNSVKESTVVTTNPKAVRCRGCREMMGL